MHSTIKLLFRHFGRKYPKFDKRYLAPEPPYGDLDFGNVGEGLHRYEMDFLEAAEYTQDMLESLENDRDLLSNINTIPYEPSKHPACVFTTDYHSFDFTKPNPLPETKVVVQVSRLDLSKEERHVFLLLAGDKYDPYSDTLELIPEIDSLGPEVDRYNSLLQCHQKLKAMIEMAKTEKGLTDLKVDLSHVRPKRAAFDFPKEWLIKKEA